MQRRETIRPIAAVTALVFMLLGAGDLFGLSVCAHHEPAAAENHGASHHASSTGAEHAHHHGAQESVPEAQHEPCTCGGYCPTATAPSLPPDYAFTVTALDVENAEAGIGGTDAAPRSRFTPFFLPYSLAPPLAN